MHVLFIVSVFVQIGLAAHAYHRGRMSPWVWIILLFPFVGSLLYAVLFLMPKMEARRAPPPLRLRRVPRGPFASAGDRPDNGVIASSRSAIAPPVPREHCPEWGSRSAWAKSPSTRWAAGSCTLVVARCPSRTITLEQI